ncbi:hypothetical protein JCM19235_919 [Vibrio maritimus]|uniref:Uncharacterized protein n=1 Tax=Vibrio maritimus TaxID=990268 RepID=A0A090RYE6_9VIBR|nr:hypothetical protein JCM19235_919 [Vibrio maritimus]
MIVKVMITALERSPNDSIFLQTPNSGKPIDARTADTGYQFAVDHQA